MMNTNRYQLKAMVLAASFAIFATSGIAQNRDNRDNDGRERGRENRENAGRRSDDHDRAEYRFRDEDRDRFRSRYQRNLREVERHADRRQHIRAGERLPDDYRRRLKPVPSSYYREIPPPPPGYSLGYYDGYVVAYNPTTRIVADVLDLIDAATRR